jgi:hypothetical protein
MEEQMRKTSFWEKVLEWAVWVVLVFVMLIPCKTISGVRSLVKVRDR